jgi:hypothetical protein
MRHLAVILALIAVGGLVSCSEDDPVSPPANASVSGVLLDRAGEPVPEVDISYWLLPLSPTLPHPYQTRTSNDGSYSLSLPPGHYRVEMDAPNRLGYPDFGMFWDVKPGANRLDHRYSGTLVRGAGVGPDGRGLSFFRVMASSMVEGNVEAFGTYGEYRLLLKPGTYRFHADPEGYPGLPNFQFDAAVSEYDTTIDLSFSGHEVNLSVSLLGAPLPSAEVVASNPMLGNPMVFVQTQTDIHGNARMYVPSGEYDLQIRTRAPGITGPEVRRLDVQGDMTQVIDLPAVRWKVTVRRAGTLEPLTPAHVTVHEVPGPRFGSRDVDPNGTFEMVVRPDTPHDIVVALFGSTTQGVVSGVTTSADATFDIVVDLPPAP